MTLKATMFIPRKHLHTITERLKDDKHKIAVIYGPRQVGKTTLANEILSKLPYKALSIDADKRDHHQILSSRSMTELEGLVDGYEILFIDEAQRIPNIGINLKIIHDHLPKLRILVTGSSSLDLASKIKEPLTGRKWSYKLFPISYTELKQLYNNSELKDQNDERLIFGSYPEVFQIKNRNEKVRFLTELSNGYLCKDILDLQMLRKPYKVQDLLRLLAFQVGSEVSLHEIATKLEISRDAVSHYLYLLEESFIIFRLGSYSRNLRKEIIRKSKYFFWDNGIRNAIIGDFNDLDKRNDKGALWENFVIAERLKYLQYSQKSFNSYFWRTYTGAEIDYVEEGGGEVTGYEIKWKSKKAKCPETWKNTYNGKFQLITQENYLDFIT